MQKDLILSDIFFISFHYREPILPHHPDDVAVSVRFQTI